MTRKVIYVVVDTNKTGIDMLIRAFASKVAAEDMVELLNSTSSRPNFKVELLWFYE